MRRFRLWITAVLFVYAVIVTVFCFYRNPLPFPDRGHRGFAVPSEKAAKVVVEIFESIGLSERFTFDSGPTHQTLMWDNATVIMQLDQSVRDLGLAPNFISLPVSNPRARAWQALTMLKEAGFTGDIKENVNPEVGDKLVLLSSNAFDGWVMVFRRHVLAMGMPVKRKLAP